MQRSTTDETTQELIQFLSDPATYDGAPQVQFIETHISLVFLAGGDVYKIKKPVEFDFLDFSTVALRKVACEAEVRLNRRMASNVYKDVVPIRKTVKGTLTLRGTERDEIVDYAVHMRRLDESRTLTQRLKTASAKKKVADIENVAKFVAKFYAAQAPATVRTDVFRKRIRKHIDANETQLEEMAQTAAERDQVHRIHSAQKRFLITHADLFDNRVRDGRIVDGHGDLRPDHIYLYQSPLVIDCIEFNRDYRTNDIVDELAFLAMCCDRMGEPTVGASLFSQYEAASGDHCDPRLVAFYQCYRACVRAKVAGLRSAQQAKGRAENSECREHGYLDLASRYAKSLDRPFVLLVGGLMGSGKSTLAHELQALLSAELISSDAMRHATDGQDLANANESEGYGTGKYSRDARMANYDRMIKLARTLVPRNDALIFDATFTLQAARDSIAKFARENGFVVLQVECVCPREEAVSRIAERIEAGGAESEALPEHFDRQVADAEAPLDSVPIVRVDTTLALAEEKTLVLEALTSVIASPAQVKQGQPASVLDSNKFSKADCPQTGR